MEKTAITMCYCISRRKANEFTKEFTKEVNKMVNNSEYWTADKICQRIDFFLNKKGWTYNRLSNESEIGISMLYEMRRKHFLPRIKNLCSICDALGITLNEFFDVEERYNIDNISSQLKDLTSSQIHAIRQLIDIFKSQS